MPEVTRVVRSSYRDRDDYSSDDDRSSYGRSRAGGSSYRTVQRYRVTPSRVEEVEDDRRSSRLDIPRDGGERERTEVDRRVERFVAPERPRSAIDIRPRSTVVERFVEREPIREPERERTRTVVYERERPREPESARPWERNHRPWETERDVRETDITVEREKRVERNRPWESERDVRESDVTIEKRVERREEPRRDDGYEVERYQRETEYYDRPEPAPQPIVIRQRAPEPQQIIVQEAPPPPPIVLPPREEQGFQVIRRAEAQQEIARPEPRQEDEYYYRRDVREIGPPRDDYYDRREVRPRDSVSDEDYSDGSDYVVKRKIIKRERSGSPHRKRHLAEGALAGAGVAALLANHREKSGNAPEHRGRNVIGGAALGAIGTELVTRARSRYRERYDDRSRSRSSSRHSHSKIKTALGIGVAAIAAAAAAKYVQNRNANKEEMGRGRSRTRSVSRRRHSYDDDYDSDSRARSKSRHDGKHRAATIAKAGAATAAVAGVVEHFRNKSRKRSGERSRSRLRTGAEIAGAGLAGAAVAGLYENRKAKEERDEDLDRDKRERSRSRRRSRSRARSIGAYSDPGVDPELGMVQYGTEPVYPQQTTTYRGFDYDPALAAGGAAAYGANREPSRSRSHRRRHSSASSNDRKHRSRSRSRVRDFAGAAAATGAAAVGVHQYKKRREKKEAERERERRRYEEEPPPENYYAHDYHDDYSPSPPHASGGSYYPETNQFAPPPTAGPSFTQHTNQSTTHINEPPIPPYNPQDYVQPGAAAPHDPYGYPPPRAGDNVSANIPLQTAVPPISTTRGTGGGEVPYFPPPPTAPLEPNVDLRDEGRINPEAHAQSPPSQPDILTPPSSRSISPLTPVPDHPHNKSVMFAPLSPTSTRRLERVHAAKNTPPPSASYAPATTYADDMVYDDPSQNDSPAKPRHRHHHHRSRDQDADSENTGHKRRRHRRRNSDPSSDRPSQPSKHRRRTRNASRSPSVSGSEVEELPARFDDRGRPLDGRRGESGGGGQGEMVEKLARDFGDVVDGRKSWKDLLGGLMEGGGLGALGGGGSDKDAGSSRRRRRD